MRVTISSGGLTPLSSQGQSANKILQGSKCYNLNSSWVLIVINPKKNYIMNNDS